VASSRTLAWARAPRTAASLMDTDSADGSLAKRMLHRVMSTPEIAGVRMQDIGEKVGSLDHRRSEIIAALDYLFIGI
jgi:CcdB protein